MLKLEKHESVFVLRMTSGENRFNAMFCDALERALDEVEKSEGPAALVTVGEGKFYSNGLDLEWMAKVGADETKRCVGHVHRLLGRLVTFPVITVAAMNGHAFAAGAMWALAHDFRVMRNDRGFFCLPEVDIQIPFTPPMAALIQAKLSKLAAHESMTTGKRYTAEEAVARSIVHAAAPEADVLHSAQEIARANAGKPRATLGAIKRTMYADVLGTIAREKAENA
ncbi:MAG TPA: enoyl-CoA hydratase-related protein [Polyangiales bacterium]|jgi:enoyl-CoA hydratase/carnithine racemase|nr:enoyl-CoA hydratase-related protein [Polyangiales bacterium]